MMSRAKVTMYLITVWVWITWPMMMGWTKTDVPGFSWLARTENGNWITTAVALLITLLACTTRAAFSSSRRCRWLSWYRDQWVSVLILGFLAVLYTYTFPDIIASEQGSRLFKTSVDLERYQIKPECQEQVNEAVSKGTRFFSQLSATIAFLLHIFPASALTTIVLLGQIVFFSMWRYSVLWKEWYGVPLLDVVGFVSLACEFGVLATLCIALNSSLRKQFLLNWNTTRTKDERIEQLHGEKERLEYERMMASQKSSRLRRASGSEGSGPDVSEYTSRSAPTSTQTPCH
jgi:hypothetical protein